MNERIKELVRQAGFFPELNYDHTGWHAAGHNELFEKFAELIVRECGVALNPPVQNRNVISRGQAYDLIKKHFEVEE